MSVHYKFKSALDFDTISFDGLHISVSDLKREIISKKKLGKTQDFDLQITNAQTKEEYGDDTSLIPKNTSLIIARVPLAIRQSKKSWDPTADKNAAAARSNKNLEAQTGNIDLTQMNGTEEEKINAMMKQSTMDYDPRNYQKVRGGAQTGDVPSSYRCYKCQKMGHWIKNCPLNVHHEHVEVKRNTGIPRSFIDAAAAGNSLTAEPAVLPPIETKQEIPEDLICSICKDLFNDAVMIPCCGSSFCDECVRTALLESEDNECPDCNEKGSSPGSLIPNRFLRNSVNSFKNETGYNKPRPKKETPAVVEEPAQTEEEVPEVKQTDQPTNTPSTEATSERSDETVSAAPDDTKQAEAEEKSNECSTPQTDPHDESDYEDNITVTVPKPQSQSQALSGSSYYRDRTHLNGRYGRPMSVPDAGDTAPPQHQPPPQMNMNSRYGAPPQQSSQHGHPPVQPPLGHHHRSMAPNHFPPNQNAGPMPMQPYDVYGMQQGNKKPMGMNAFYPNNYYPNQGAFYPKTDMPRHSMDIRGNFNAMPPMHSQNSHMMGHQPPPMHHRMRAPIVQQSNAVASAYQGVADKIGTGIIEDPLAAFEQIMKEKERRKKERRVNEPSPRRRSRSIDRRRSPTDRRSPRHISTERDRDRDRGRSTDFRSNDNTKERSTSRGRDRGRGDRGDRGDRGGRMNERRRRRSGSYHSRQSWEGRSYSRSRSNSPRRHSRTPHRKYSRSPQHRRSRSRSASHPRNRHRDGRDTVRRDYRDREDYRERSPNHYHSYHRHPANQSYQPPPSMPPQSHTNMPYFDSSMSMMNPNSSNYREHPYQDMQQNRYDMMPSSNIRPMPTNCDPSTAQIGLALQEIRPMEANMLTVDQSTHSAGSQQYDVLPPGVESPPPPGCEADSALVPHKRHNRDTEWSVEHKTEKEIPPEQRQTRRQELSPQRPSAKSRSRSPSRAKVDRNEKTTRKSSTDRDKSRDDRRDQHREREKDKDKRKKKKVDKTLEKKKKKDKKQREKVKKEQHRGKKLSKTNTTPKDDKHRNSADSASNSTKAEVKAPENIDRFSTSPTIQKIDTNVVPAADIDTITIAPAAVAVLPTITPITTNIRNIDDDSIDLYSDVNIDAVNDMELYSADDFGITGNVSKLNRSESILDIHTNVDFGENDLQESDSEQHTANTIASESIFTPMPEPSKWEREDDIGFDKNITDPSPTDDQSKVTNEVLKRAENAIFARAINAIRPIEIKKISQERQKLYDGKRDDDGGLTPTELISTSSDKPTVDNSLQITLNNSEKERSVEIRGGSRHRNKTPTRSIRERLGRKIGDNVDRRSGTPEAKLPTNRNDLDKNRSKDRHYDNDKHKSISSSDKKRHDSRDRQKSSDRQYKEKSDRGGHSFSGKDRKNKPDSRSGSTNRDRRDHSIDKSNRNHDARANSRGSALNRDRRQPDPLSRSRDRDVDRARELARIREGNRTQQKPISKRSTTKGSSQPKSSKEQREFRDVKDSKHGQSGRNDERTTNDATDIRSSSSNKRHIDESHFEPDYDEQPIEDNAPADGARVKKSKTVDQSNSKRLSRKRSRSNSASSSSSSESSSSSSDEGERKRKKKRKNKKQKKSKRATSDASSTVSSSDDNKKKSKKRAKKAKKKKKTKK